MTRRYPLRAAVAVLTLALFAGCSRTGDPGGDSVSLPANTSISATAAPATTSTSTTSATLAPGGTAPDGTPWKADQLALIDAYRGYYETFRRASFAGDQKDSGFTQFMTERVRQKFQVLIAQRQTAGMSVRAGTPPVNDVVIVSVDVSGNQGTVVACAANNDVIYRTDGSVVNDKTGTTKSTNELVIEDGVWKVNGGSDIGTWDGEALTTCADSSS